MYNTSSGTTLFSSGELRQDLIERQLKLQGAVERLTAEEVRGRGEIIAQLLAKHTVKPITLLDDEKKRQTKETTVTRQDWPGEYSKVSGVEVTVTMPFEGEALLFYSRPATYRVSGMPTASISGRMLTISQTFAGVPTPEAVRSWYQRELESLRWYLSEVEAQVGEYNAAIEQLLPELIGKRAAQLDALRKFEDDLDLDAG